MEFNMKKRIISIILSLAISLSIFGTIQASANESYHGTYPDKKYSEKWEKIFNYAIRFDHAYKPFITYKMKTLPEFFYVLHHMVGEKYQEYKKYCDRCVAGDTEHYDHNYKIPYSIFYKDISSIFNLDNTGVNLKEINEDYYKYDSETDTVTFYAYGGWGGDIPNRYFGYKKIDNKYSIYSVNCNVEFLEDDKYIFSIDAESTYRKVTVSINNDGSVKLYEAIPVTIEEALTSNIFVEPEEFKIQDIEKPVVIGSDKISTEEVELQITKSSEKTINVDLTKSDVASKEIFRALKGIEKEIAFNILDDKGKIKYSWTFEGKNITDANTDVNLGLSLDCQNSDISNLVENKNALILSFSHSGNLPGLATVKVFVGDKYKNGEILYFYYFNSTTKKLEYINDGITVKDGYATVSIKHCSDYVLTTSKVVDKQSNNPKTGDNSSPITMIILVIASCSALILLKKKSYKNFNN
jgi:hypothetical protein